MKSRTVHRRILAASLLLYFIVSTATAAIRQDPARVELFPCFCWGLFCIVPSPEHRSEFGLGIDSAEVSGAFEKSGKSLPYARSIEAYFVIQSLGLAVERQDSAAADRAEETLRRRYLEGLQGPAIVTVVRRIYDPVTRFTTGDMTSETPVYEFRLSSGEYGTIEDSAGD